MDKTSLKKIVNSIPVLKYWYIVSFPLEFVPNFPNDTFAIINTQPSNTTGEHRTMIEKLHHVLYFAASLGLSLRKLPLSIAELHANDTNKATS